MAYLSQAAWKEYQNQDVFPDMDSFIAAMPEAIRMVHMLPEGVKGVPGYVKIGGDEGYFSSPLVGTHVTESEDSAYRDVSMWDVNGPKYLPKDQSQPDETEIYFKPQGPIDYKSLPYPKGSLREGSDDATQHPYRGLDSREREITATWVSTQQPIEATLSKVAVDWKSIINGIDRSIEKSSKICSVRLKRAYPDYDRWVFEVHTPGSPNRHVVSIKAIRKGNTSTVDKLDLKIGCSCDFWKWQGPDYHAHKYGYLGVKPSSDLSSPDKKDPDHRNKICKHVYAASEYFLKYTIDT